MIAICIGVLALFFGLVILGYYVAGSPTVGNA
jgi:hypothetical protein